jgi:TolB-like protein
MSGEAPESGPSHPPTGPPAAVRVPNASIHVFISYASQDAAVADTVVGALERAGLRCWIAPRDVVPGALYADEIVRAINESKVVVLILSEQAVASSHVGKEIERASSKRRRIIALRTASVTLTRAFEYFLSESQWIDVGAGSIEAKLVDAVRRHLTPDSAIEPSIPREGRTYGQKSATSRGRWLVIALVAVVAVAVAYFVIEKFSLAKHLTTDRAATQNVVSDKSVAVLPFTDMSETKDQEYFADGMAEEIIDLLVKVPELKVPARTSSFYFKGKSITIPEIARELGVAHVLEGSVRKSGSHLRVTTQLVSAANGYHLWSETYDRQLEDVFKTQDEIAGAVVAALKLKLAPGQQATSSHRTSNPDAYNQYLLGRQFFEGFTLDGFRRAVDAYRKAIQLDPNYAAAYAELAISEFFVADQTDDTAQKQQALVTADKAVALAPDEADGYADRGYLRYEFAWDWTGAQSDFAKALALNPGDNRFQRRYAQLLGSLGRLTESVAVLKKATELDPLSSLTWTVFGNYLTADRQFAAAEQALRRALEIQPDSGFALGQLGIVQLLTGNPTEALTTFRKRGGSGFSLIGIAMAEHSLGHVKESQHALDEAIAKHAQDSAYAIAGVYAWRGEKDDAFAWLERAFQQRDGGLSDIKDDLLLASLRHDARFGAMLRKMQLPE